MSALKHARAGADSRRLSPVVFVWIAAILSAAASFAQCTYSWQRVPNPPGGALCFGRAINNLGAVAGYIGTSGDSTTAFMWSPKTGRVQLPVPAGVTTMEATGINDLGHVAGRMWGQAGGWRGFVWDGSQYTLIQRPSWANSLDVNGINNSDQVVGMVTNVSTGPGHAFIWSNGVMTDIGIPPGMTYGNATAVNDVGDVIGIGATNPPPQFHAWRYTGGTFSELEMPAGLSSTDARALNNNGFVVGRGEVPIGFHGVVWMPWGTYAFAPPIVPQHPQCEARGVNDAGRVVGGAASEGFIWQNGRIDLIRPLLVPQPIWLGGSGKGINRVGQIVATCEVGTVVLTPNWLVGDLTGDCHVGLDDLLIVLANFGLSQGTFPRGDVNGDGQVDVADITLMLSHWGE